MSKHRDTNFLIEVARGNIPNTDIVSIIGTNTATGTTSETIWPEGGMVSFPSSASSMTVSSSNTNDNSSGSGARMVRIDGLDEDWEPITEIVTLNGQTAVNTTNSYLRVNLMTVLFTGSSKKNEGIIYVGTGAVTAGKPANVVNLIGAEDGLSHSGFFSVPNNHNFYLIRGNFSTTSSKNLTFTIEQYVGTLDGTLIKGTSYDVFQQLVDIPFLPSDPYPAKSDVFITGLTDSGTADARINLAGFTEKVLK